MPVYFFTFRAYRSWRLDDSRGYIQRGTPGVQNPNSALDAYRQDHATSPPVRFTSHQQQVLIEAVKDFCTRRAWILYAVSVDSTHAHALVGWTDEAPLEPKCIRMKSLLGKALSDDLGSTGNRWFSRGQHTERVMNERHLEELITRYIPKHGLEGGTVYQKKWGRQDA